MYKKREIKEKINRSYKEEEVKEIVFRIKQ